MTDTITKPEITVPIQNINLATISQKDFYISHNQKYCLFSFFH